MGKNFLNLSQLPVGSGGVVSEVHNTGSMRRRLIDLGFCVGTKILCVGRAPLGDPKAFWVKGTVIALREEDSQKIRVGIL